MTTPWELVDLRVTLGGRAVLDGCSLRLERGERVGLVGASGSGKTTLARAGLGLIPSAGGVIRLFGEDVGGWSTRRWTAARRHAQLLFQDPRAMLHPQIPVGLLLADGASVHRPDRDALRLARESLDRVGLADRFDALPHELSGGEQRRVGVARVLLTRPKLLVADEPTVGLDAALKADLLTTLLDGLDPDCAVLLVSHDRPVIAWATHRVVHVRGGRLVDDVGVA